MLAEKQYKDRKKDLAGDLKKYNGNFSSHMKTEHSIYRKQTKKSLDSMPQNQSDGYVLTEIAKKLDEAKKNPNEEEKFKEALRLNWRFWTIIQAEISEDHCPLPEEIKINLFVLCNYVDRKTIEMLASLDTEKIDILISINRQISAGLLGDPGEGAPKDKLDKVILATNKPKDTAKLPDGVRIIEHEKNAPDKDNSKENSNDEAKPISHTSSNPSSNKDN